MPSSNAPVVSGEDKALTSTPSAACTCACTSTDENANADAPDADQQGRPAGDRQQSEGIDQGDPLARLATELAKLSPEDQQRLAAMLAG